jgi:hypothetical protein
MGAQKSTSIWSYHFYINTLALHVFLVECTSVQNSGLRIRELQDEKDIAMKQS